MSNTPVILYGYDASPFATKVKNLLLLKKIPHKRVDVSMMLPRPEITDLLGVKYRRIPILAIGNDIYCDTSLIANVLERRFPTSQGYGTLFPPRVGTSKADTGLAKAVTVYWNDKVVFPLGGNSLPYGKLGASFLADRSQWAGAPIDPTTLAKGQGVRTSTLASHFHLVEEQLSDGRQWLLDTEKPGLVDVDVHFLLSWLQTFKNLKEIYDPAVVPKTLEWIARTTAYLKEQEQGKVASYEKISGDAAAKVVASASYEDEKVVGFVETEAKRLGVAFGDTVSVIPTDNAKIATVGRLISLNREEFAIEVVGTVGKVRVHFPRLEFSLKIQTPATSKL
ncbi:hypothetical protein BDY19DRAFT_944414 [Irpex rosettiformis]|uniref:Uncharacterized protein n=1 Tax=Irpex rosettiformis TaxID=378272 RepID=A0ACB8U4J6_9APHY|nr:hypothetical protein BDY19DRAFT_944414 [Irpex rosettiformis]